MAIGYYKNFIADLVECVQTAENLKIDGIEYSDFKVKVVIPVDLKGMIREKAHLFYKRNGFSANAMKAKFRKHHLWFQLDPKNAPTAIMYDMPSMGGFIYKDLNNSPEGDLISWYNVQCYEECSFEIYNSMVNNGYIPSKIVIGMLGDSFDSLSFIPVMEEINKIKTKYPNMAGCILWEYGDTHINPIEWGINI